MLLEKKLPCKIIKGCAVRHLGTFKTLSNDLLWYKYFSWSAESAPFLYGKAWKGKTARTLIKILCSQDFTKNSSTLEKNGTQEYMQNNPWKWINANWQVHWGVMLNSYPSPHLVLFHHEHDRGEKKKTQKCLACGNMTALQEGKTSSWKGLNYNAWTVKK